MHVSILLIHDAVDELLHERPAVQFLATAGPTVADLVRREEPLGIRDQQGLRHETLVLDETRLANQGGHGMDAPIGFRVILPVGGVSSLDACFFLGSRFGCLGSRFGFGFGCLGSRFGNGFGSLDGLTSSIALRRLGGTSRVLHDGCVDDFYAVSFLFNFFWDSLVIDFDSIMIHGPSRRVLPPALENACFRLHHITEHLARLAGRRDV